MHIEVCLDNNEKHPEPFFEYNYALNQVIPPINVGHDLYVDGETYSVTKVEHFFSGGGRQYILVVYVVKK